MQIRDPGWKKLFGSGIRDKDPWFATLVIEKTAVFIRSCTVLESGSGSDRIRIRIHNTGFLCIFALLHTAALLCERHARRLQPFLLACPAAAADQRRTQQQQRRRRSTNRTPIGGGGGRWTGNPIPTCRHRQRQATVGPGRAERLVRAAEFEKATQLERLLRVGLLTAVLLLLSRFLRGYAAAAVLKKRAIFIFFFGGGGVWEAKYASDCGTDDNQLCVVRTMLNWISYNDVWYVSGMVPRFDMYQVRYLGLTCIRYGT